MLAPTPDGDEKARSSAQRDSAAVSASMRAASAASGGARAASALRAGPSSMHAHADTAAANASLRARSRSAADGGGGGGGGDGRKYELAQTDQTSTSKTSRMQSMALSRTSGGETLSRAGSGMPFFDAQEFVSALACCSLRSWLRLQLPTCSHESKRAVGAESTS